MDKITIKLVDFTNPAEFSVNGTSDVETITRVVLADQINKVLHVAIPGAVTGNEDSGSITYRTGKAAKVFQTVEYRADGLYADVLPLEDEFGTRLRILHALGRAVGKLQLVRKTDDGFQFNMFLVL